MAKPQKFGNETYDAPVLAKSKTYRNQNKPKKEDSEPADTCHFDRLVLVLEYF